MAVPQVLNGRQASQALKRGFDQIADLLAITLGPTQGIILSKHETKSAPETLFDAATIARRIIALPDRAENVGAMLVRNLAWRQQQRAGDGCATAAVLAQAILDEGNRFIAAGGNPRGLQRGIERAAGRASDALRKMARPVKPEELEHVAEAITADATLSGVLAEVFRKLGPDAHVNIEDYPAPCIERQYSEGGRWNGRLASPYLITDPAQRRAVIQECHVVLYDGEVKSCEDVQPMLEMVNKTKWHQVALIAKGIGGEALATLVVNHRRKQMKILAAELRESEERRKEDFDDLAALTGATVISPKMGRLLKDIAPPDLGAAPRVEADAEELIVVGGEGDTDAMQQRAAVLRARLAGQPESEAEAKDLRFRLARLNGQIAKLLIGANMETERQLIRQKAEKVIRALPMALRDGVVPGGGVAYLNCIPAVRAAGADREEQYASEIVEHALEEPMRRILLNAGIEAPASFIAKAQRRGTDYGCDVRSGDVVCMPAVGILDPVGVLCAALQTAVSCATMAITTHTLVLHRNPQVAREP